MDQSRGIMVQEHIVLNLKLRPKSPKSKRKSRYKHDSERNIFKNVKTWQNETEQYKKAQQSLSNYRKVYLYSKFWFIYGTSVKKYTVPRMSVMGPIELCG